MKLSIATAMAFATLVTTGLTFGVATSQAAKLGNTAKIKKASIDRRAVARYVRKQARAKGMKLSPRQVNAAVNQAVGGFKSNGPGVQKIIIRINTRRLDICIATGRHRGQCG